MTENLGFLNLCHRNANTLLSVIRANFKLCDIRGENYQNLKHQGLCLAIRETTIDLNISFDTRNNVQDHFTHWLQQWAFWRGLSPEQSRYPLNQDADQYYTFAKQGRLYQGDQLKLRLHCLNLYIQHLETMINENKNQDN